LTDCLSGDIDKDFSNLWQRISEFVPLPQDMAYGTPLEAAQRQTVAGLR